MFPWKLRVAQLAIILGLGTAGFFYVKNFFREPTSKTEIVHDVKTTTIEVPVLTTKVVKQVVTDPKDLARINALLAENKALKVDVTGLANTIAELRSAGGGHVVTTPEFQGFTDWQLDAKWKDSLFSYTLTQKFIIETSYGVDDLKRKVIRTNLYQLGPVSGAPPISIKTFQTFALFSNPDAPKWRVAPRIQAGAGLVNGQMGGVVAFQWLGKGSGTATESTKWAIASPALFFASSGNQLGLLPMSFNVGSLPHSPFTNLWLSPFVNKQVVGGVVTATF